MTAAGAKLQVHKQPTHTIQTGTSSKMKKKNASIYHYIRHTHTHTKIYNILRFDFMGSGFFTICSPFIYLFICFFFGVRVCLFCNMLQYADLCHILFCRSLYTPAHSFAVAVNIELYESDRLRLPMWLLLLLFADFYRFLCGILLEWAIFSCSFRFVSPSNGKRKYFSYFARARAVSLAFTFDSSADSAG